MPLARRSAYPVAADSAPAFFADGTSIYFLSDRGETNQVWWHPACATTGCPDAEEAEDAGSGQAFTDSINNDGR